MACAKPSAVPIPMQLTIGKALTAGSLYGIESILMIPRKCG
ncbi:unnamed protein product [Haemonchus placei]|uniref:Uncharacterized protein n=1 Tax=Haemonchus placei TaxID=6290 RepID=A0A0N4WQQ4_HAEPC|nr:unnamed protein product [Haemonchus placei]